MSILFRGRAVLARLARRLVRAPRDRGWADDDFYSPLNNITFLAANPDLWETPHEPEGIDWNLDRQMATAQKVAAYVPELKEVPLTAPSGEYCWNNPFWNNADALVQYGLVRAYQPRRYIEIGCGYSSLLLEKALAKNSQPCEVTLIEPHPNWTTLQRLENRWSFHQSILQRAPFSFFETLEEGDFLFYDGSHCTKAASDVNWFFFHILPRLRPGVVIHLHDIFLPRNYPREWIFARRQTWNEQYLLQAFLMHNTCYQVLIANQYLFYHRRELLDQLYGGVQPSMGCSLWMVKTGK